MADRKAYQAAMREAASAAWDQDYQRAIALYQQALEIIPDDAQALAGLALSLMEIGQQAEALKAYGRVSQLVPNDPLPLEKIALILEGIQGPAATALFPGAARACQGQGCLGAKGNGLVLGGGASPKPDEQPTKRVRVDRSFHVRRLSRVLRSVKLRFSLS